MSRHKTTRIVEPSSLPDLPVRACLPELIRALHEGHAVLTAEPGSGKTTLVPLLLLDEPWLAGKKIVVLEPRRPAARMAARRMASLIGCALGETVGYQVRFDRKVSSGTRIEVLTEGLLLRRLQNDPTLDGIGLVVFDEFHERNLYSDLSLALCLDVCAGLREDLRILAMSATIDAMPLAQLMDAPVVSATGRCHDIEIRHAERDHERAQWVDACMRALDIALSERSGDVLVFLPGRAEIERLRAEVDARWSDQVDAEPLYGDLPAARQDAVLSARNVRRRVVIATDIAETSLTIEGIDTVIDAGLTRKPSFDPNTGLTRLETRWISKAAARQRAGRAGRLGPGVCLRLWSEARQRRLEDWTAAEITVADLAPLVLELANWGVADSSSLRWLDVPPPAHWRQAAELLMQLDGLDANGRITPNGRAMAQLPLHPRFAHMLVMACDDESRRLAADIAALLSERDPLRRTRDQQRDTDIARRLDALRCLRARQTLPRDVDRVALERVDRSASQLLRLSSHDAGHGSASSVGALLALAFPERVAMCTSTDGCRYLMRNGHAAKLDVGDGLCGEHFLAIASVDAGRREGRIWLAAPLTVEEVEALFAPRIQTAREVRWDAGLDDVVARRVRRLDALVLDDRADSLLSDDPVSEVLLAQIRRAGLTKFFDDPSVLRARVELMRQIEPDGEWPDFSETDLLESLETWLIDWLKPGQGARQLRKLSLADMLLARFDYQQRQRLDALLPNHFDTPAGTRRRIEYVLGEEPVISVPLQEMLGASSGPVLAGGRVEPLLHLLSPAGRPLQITRDLAAFWRGAYAEVKKEMRGRYPKHFWPDDPANATPTRRTKRGMKN